MLKKLLITTAVSGLMLSAALAQSSMSPSSPSTKQPGASTSQTTTQDKSDMSKSSATTSGSVQFVSAQKPDQLLASKVKGTNVIGPDNAKIGDVSDILFSKDGKIDAYVVSVGGFLGMGAKEVALEPSAMQIAQDENNNLKISVSLTKDQLKQAPDFQPLKAQASTMGSAPSNNSSSPARNTMPPPK